jgi:hypothetical protein
MVKHKDDFTAGLEQILNNPSASFITNPKTFKEIHSASGMSYSEMIRHVGRGSKKQKVHKPTDAERSEERLGNLEARSEK